MIQYIYFTFTKQASTLHCIAKDCSYVSLFIAMTIADAFETYLIEGTIVLKLNAYNLLAFQINSVRLKGFAKTPQKLALANLVIDLAILCKNASDSLNGSSPSFMFISLFLFHFHTVQ